MLWVGLSIAAVSLFAQAWAIHIGSAHWQSMVFTVLNAVADGHVLAIRSERDSFFQPGTVLQSLFAGLGRPHLFAANGHSLPTRAERNIPHQPLTLNELGVCLALSSVVFFSVELEKLLVRRGVLYSQANGR